MRLADVDLIAGNRHVELFRLELCFQRSGFQRSRLLFDFFLDCRADFIRELTDNGSFLCGELAHAAQNGGQLSFFSQILDPQRFYIGTGVRESLQRIRFDFQKRFFHGSSSFI